MTLPSNPNGITNLPDTRDRAPTLTPAVGELGCANLPSTRAAKEFIQACDGCDSDELKKNPGKIELCRCRNRRRFPRRPAPAPQNRLISLRTTPPRLVKRLFSAQDAKKKCRAGT